MTLRRFLYIFFALILLLSKPSSAQTKFFGDSLLYALSMEMYDSIRNEKAFFEMCERGLTQAVAKQNNHFDHVFRTSPLGFYHTNRQYEKYFEKAAELIEYYKSTDQVRSLYNIWFKMHGQYLSIGDYAEAITTARAMSDYALAHNHKEGIATANLCFGTTYNNNFQYDEALARFKVAFREYREIDNNTKVATCGFNICASYINSTNYEQVLQYCDTIQVHINRWESEKGNVNPVMRTRLYRYRMLANINLKRKKEAIAAADSMKYYNNIYADASESIPVYYALSRYEDFVGNYKESVRMLKSLIEHYSKSNNYEMLSAYYRTLGHQAYLRGDKELALDSYYNFSKIIDSANVEKTSIQLNRLTKLFRLQELEQEKEVAELELEREQTNQAILRNWIVSIAIIALLILTALSMVFYLYRRLKQRNRDLYRQIESVTQSHTRIEKLYQSTSNTSATASEIELSKTREVIARLSQLMESEQLYKDANLTKEKLADILNVNRNILSNCIKEAYDQTYTQYITALRLNASILLIKENPNIDLHIVAESVGYGSYSAYYRAFVKYFGINPTEYIRISKQGQRQVEDDID